MRSGLSPRPGRPDDERSTGDFDDAAEDVVACWWCQEEGRELYNSHKYSGGNVGPPVQPIGQEERQGYHGHWDLDEDCGAQEESLCHRHTIYCAGIVLPQ